MLNITWRELSQRIRTFTSYCRCAEATVLLALAVLVHLPAMAADSCSHLGIQTVNWKSPDRDQTAVLVLQVQPNCVASELGVKPGDLITAFDGKPIHNQYDLETLAGKQAADRAFSLTVADGQAGTSRTLRRAALTGGAEKIPADARRGVPDEWLSWYKWAGLFLLLTLTVTPVLAWLLKNNVLTVLATGAAGGMYDEYKNYGRNYLEAGFRGALMALVGFIVVILIGPVGLVYALYQPLSAALSDADGRLCCADDTEHALSPDGRWLAMAKPTPDRYFGLGDKIAPAPYLTAMADLQTGEFVALRGAIDKRWLGIQPSAGNSSLEAVSFDDEDGQPLIAWSNGFSTPLAPDDQTLPIDPPAPRPYVQFEIASDAGGKFEFTDLARGNTFVLDPGMPYDKWWLSPDGRVLALAKRPYQPNPEHDGWLKRAWYAFRNFSSPDWTVTFVDVSGARKLASYTGYGYDEARWDDGRCLEASLDGRRWILVRDNGYVLTFDLSDKLPSGFGAAAPSERLYQASTELAELVFYQEADAPSPENLKNLAALAGLYPSTILEQNPHLNEALRRTLGRSYAPLMETLSVQMPATATADDGLAFTQCKAHACFDAKIVVYISPSFQVSALLFHNDGEINLPETPASGQADPDSWSRLVLYAPSAYPLRMPKALYDAALSDLDGMQAFATDAERGRVSERFWIVGTL